MAMMVIGRHAVIANFGWCRHEDHLAGQHVYHKGINKGDPSTRSRDRVAYYSVDNLLVLVSHNLDLLLRLRGCYPIVNRRLLCLASIEQEFIKDPLNLRFVRLCIFCYQHVAKGGTIKYLSGTNYFIRRT